jgi:ATP-binding cassette subfamily B protein
LFNDTLRENIRMGKRNTKDEDLRIAIEGIRLGEMVAGMPHGLNTLLGEKGARLSAGEVQRVALARAFLAGSSIVVMDEPTAHLDPELELLLQEATSRLCEIKTTLVIAHRLSTVRDADVILVMEDGKIVERGRHEDLVAQDGLYTRMLTAGAKPCA